MEYSALSKEKLYEKIEENYWKYHSNKKYSDLKFEYVSDLPSHEYSSWFSTDPNNEYSNHPWNFNIINKEKDSLLQFCKEEIFSGITVPWVYIGEPYSSFWWHYEDLMMYSVNYMHEGSGKIWYALSSVDISKFEKFVKKKYKNIMQRDPDVLKSLNLQINPIELLKNDIKVYRTIQKPGEFILTFPGSYHSGVSVGYHMAEAINFTWATWLKHWVKAIEVYISEGSKRPIFPLEWLLVQNIRHFQHIDLSFSARKKIVKQYDKWLQDELLARKIMLELYENDEEQKSLHVFSFKNRDNVSEDKFECSQWANLCYISLIKCIKWKTLYCLMHGICWGCTKEDIKIVFRYSEEELILIGNQAREILTKMGESNIKIQNDGWESNL